MIIHLIAPSGYPLDMNLVKHGLAFLRNEGHIIRNENCASRRYQRFAGDDFARLAEINSIANLPKDTQIVMTVKGGYGLSRLLSGIDYEKIIARILHSNLKLVGHSDFTALQLALFAKNQKNSLLCTYSGPMLCPNFGKTQDNTQISTTMLNSFYLNMHAKFQKYNFNASNSPNYSGSGTIWGGNLSILVSLLGTEYFPVIKNGILVVEDTNEDPYRIERMLLQLYYAGVLDEQKALVLGSFTNDRLQDYDQRYDYPTMVCYLRTMINTPIIMGLSFGHIPDTITLPMGSIANLSVHNEQACLSFV